MKGVLRPRRDAGVTPGDRHAQGCEHRVVIGMDQVMGRPGMGRIAAKHRLADRRRAHRRAEISRASRPDGQQRQGMQRGGVEVVRIALLHPRHRRLVCLVACRPGALAVQRFDRGEVSALARCLAAGDSGLGGTRQAQKRGSGGGGIVLAPERMIVGQRLAPVRHGERRVQPLRLPKGVGRVIVLEAVQEREPAEECRLRLGGAGCGEGDAAQARRLRLGRERRGEREG